MERQSIEDLLAEVAEVEEAAEQEERPHYRNRRRSASPSQVYSIRIPVDQLEELRRMAEHLEVAPTAMMRDWILERLEASQAPKPRLDYQFRGRLRDRLVVKEYQSTPAVEPDAFRAREMAR
jgi:hypothetical protein